MVTAGDLKTGQVIRLDGELYHVLDYQHVKPGKGGAYLKTRLKNMRSGVIVEKSLRAGEKVDKVFLERKKVEYLYREQDLFCFMDHTNYAQILLSPQQVGGARDLLKENEVCTALVNNSEVLSIELPVFVELKVTGAEPGVRGDTAAGATKRARLETGVEIQVPLFVEEGDTVRIDTRKQEYVERVS